MRRAATASGTVFMEAFHYLFHPVTRRLHELLAGGELGTLRRVETLVAIPAPDDTDPRWSLALAGGALMDLGCYGLHATRMLAPWAGGAPRLLSARAANGPGRPASTNGWTRSWRSPAGRARRPAATWRTARWR